MSNDRLKVEYERKRRKLEQYIEFKYDVESKERELVELKEKIETLSGAQSVKYTDMPKGGEPILFTDYIDDLVDKEKILRNSLSRAERRKIEIEEAIEKLEDSELRIVLKMKYLEDFSLSRIGYLIHCSKMTAWRKCNEGIRLIDL